MQQPDENRVHVQVLLRLMWDRVGHFSNELDEYASKLFERPIRGSWRIFVLIAKHGASYPFHPNGNSWCWDNLHETPYYPPSPKIESVDEFASSYLHEVAHGWLHVMMDYERGEKSFDATGEFITTAGNRDEEELCDEISKFVCGLLGLEFHTYTYLPDKQELR